MWKLTHGVYTAYFTEEPTALAYIRSDAVGWQSDYDLSEVEITQYIPTVITGEK